MIQKKWLVIFPIITIFIYIWVARSPLDTNPNINIPTPILTPKPTIHKLPSSHLIKTTFVPQAPEKNWDQPWQDACEEAALLTSVYYFKNQNPNLDQIKQDIQNVINYEKSLGWSKDINLIQISQIAQDYFSLKATIDVNPTIDQIKTYISQDIPVLITANGKILYRENKHFKDGGPYYHALTILGYNDSKKQFIVHDIGTQHGAYFVYSYKTLMDSIHDLAPSGDKYDINQGRAAMITLTSV